MTNKEKNEILSLRKEGYSIPRIAEELRIPLNTVKSYLYRAVRPDPQKDEEEPATVLTTDPSATSLSTPLEGDRAYRRCLYCGKAVEQLPHHKEKKFCSDECRTKWWNKNKAKSQGTSISEKTCPTCGQPFRAYGNRKYCSHQCYISARFGKNTSNVGKKVRV